MKGSREHGAAPAKRRGWGPWREGRRVLWRQPHRAAPETPQGEAGSGDSGGQGCLGTRCPPPSRVQAGSPGVLHCSGSPQGGGWPGGGRQTLRHSRSLSQLLPPPWLPAHCCVSGSERALWWAWSPTRNVPGTSASRQASRKVGGWAGCPTSGRSGTDQLQPASAPHSPPFHSPRGPASVYRRPGPAVQRLIFETKPARGRKEPDPPGSRHNWHLGSGLAPPRPRPPEAKRPPPQQWSHGREGRGFSGCLTIPNPGPALPGGPSMRLCIPYFFRAEWAHQPFPTNPCPSFPVPSKLPSGLQSIWAQKTSSTLRLEGSGLLYFGGWAVAKAKTNRQRCTGLSRRAHKVLVTPVTGVPAGAPFTDRVQRKEGSEKTPGGPEVGNNGGRCGWGTQETLHDQVGHGEGLG